MTVARSVLDLYRDYIVSVLLIPFFWDIALHYNSQVCTKRCLKMIVKEWLVQIKMRVLDIR